MTDYQPTQFQRMEDQGRFRRKLGFIIQRNRNKGLCQQDWMTEEVRTALKAPIAVESLASLEELLDKELRQ